ncbi:hypothetical protein [Micromonospora sp. NBRC 101691]|uniref:hypothetical protein n=1 Tax=Micromonospora sp. NBRC 101691 TaxID=3032198 RepID=UPI00249FF1A7|nr:hypothetical protein [Micromonospora sp. NBRC 101691]GLY24605.1 hypothetical protein Misp04_43370 [Micromonospora sp. NBRC 101691]
MPRRAIVDRGEGDHAGGLVVGSRPSVLAPFHAYLRHRLTDGVHETADLHAEIPAYGCQGSLRMLRDWLTTNRTRPTL